jgi:two-component system OmpR family sensor kinase
MKKSLQSQLSFMLGGATLFAGLVAAAVSFRFAYVEAKELQDDMLRQIAVLAISITPTDTNTNTGINETQLDDPESRVMVIHLPKDKRPNWLTSDLSTGFHTLRMAAGQLRVFVHAEEHGERTIVAQPTDARDEIAMNSAFRTLIPLLLLLPVLAWIITTIVRRELAPITQLSLSLDAQQAERPQPLNEQNLPQEITPFVLAINRLLARVHLLMTEQRRFIADAAHELRSPLTALSLQAQNIEQAKTLEVMRERIKPLREGIERARQLTEQLLSLAKSQAAIPSVSPVDVSRLARELIAEYLPQAEALTIDLGLIDEGNIVIQGDLQALSLVLKNALGNALRFTPKFGIVTLLLYTEGEDFVIKIVDSGPGIPATEREKVFQPFYRIEGADGEGTGLGLTIAQDAATKLGGSISLRNHTDETGLIFCYRQRRTAPSTPT